MERIKVSHGVPPLDPELQSFADSVFATVRLSAARAIAHSADPQRYTLPAADDSFERIVSTQFAQLRPAQQEAARATVMDVLDADQPVLARRLGGFAAVDLQSSLPVSAQVSIPALASQVVVRRSARNLLGADGIRDVVTNGSYVPHSVGRVMPLNAVMAGNGDFSIGLKYATLGGEAGFLGKAETSVQLTKDKVGRYQKFKGGTIYFHHTTGAYEVHGAILGKYVSLGAETSVLGYPLTDERTTPDGKGRYNHFQHGSIYWTAETGAHEVHGDIRKKWESLGWERSPLGYPITDESTTPDGIGRYNHFQHGSIYWSPQTGAREVHGQIRELWKSLGWEKSQLGYPATDELTTHDGKGRFNVFQNGVIFWYPDKGAYVGSQIAARKLALRVLKVHCLDETGKTLVNFWGIKVNGEKGKDDMFIGGTVVDPYGKVSKVDKISLGGYDDGDWSTFSPFHFCELPLNQQDDVWPKSFLVTMILVEQDSGGYTEFLNKLMDKLQPYVEDQLKKWLITTGVTVGAISGGFLGLAVGAIAGYVAAYVAEKLFNWLKDIWNDDIFKPVTARVEIPGPNALFDSGSYDSGDSSWWVKGHNGHYEWWTDWVVF